ncbi:MAG: alpha/beta fold hydrolase [Alphaproteobacteria bacterium]|jgi:alpha/beta superfamily hydrolase|nr:alpha/beta fold hydrolase [Alphaproteobacteria bacterium]
MPEMFLTGPQGRLEVKYHHNQKEDSPIALVIAPSPEKGGTMNNRVVFSMYKTLAQAGFSVLRFNFAGVGKSLGSYSDSGETEINDAMALLNWLQENNPQAKSVWVCGYSFGSWVGLQLVMRRPEIEKFVLVSPPTTKHDFNFLAPYPCKGKIIQGSEDTFAPEHKTSILAKELNEDKGIELEYSVVEGANHYFSGENEAKLIKSLKDYINQHLSLEN